MSQKRILIVEDDETLVRVLHDNLVYDGFEVSCVSDGHVAVDRAREFAPDLILLDVMLPGRNGFELCPVLRQGGRIPIIMLTAKGQREDKLQGLHLGADDYVTKPFDLEELLARINAVLRRTRPLVDELTMGDVRVDFRELTAWHKRSAIHLTHREFEVLRYLAERRGRVVHRNELLQEVWGYPDLPNTRSVDHAIARLRKKIERDARNPHFIITVHGDGYYLALEGGAPPLPNVSVSP
jgi:DNA-binding response OmpR family regulator